MPKNDRDADCTDAENAANVKNCDNDDDREIGAQVLQEAVNCSFHRPPLIKLQLH